MKKPEKLFLLINEINDRFVDEAKDKAEKPVSVRLDNRMPIKEIIAFAACFAVLAVGIFAFVKYKLNSRIDPQPVDNDSSNQSFELNSGIELNYTEQDKELQTILKELVANAEEIDGMFNYLSISGEKYKFKFDEYNEREYYLVPGDTRTANGLFTVPQSYDEMEQLVSQYFSPLAAVFYMENVISSGGAAESSSDGTFHIDLPGYRIPMFIEINGRMYADPGSRSYQGMGIDCETARVIRKTDKSLEFSYWGYDFTALSSEGGDKYSERNGALVYEDGAWKLHYFYNEGFIPEMPAEYTEQDLELQKILEALTSGDDVSMLFSVNSLGGSGKRYKFRLPDNDPPDSTATYIDVSGPQPEVNHPKSIDELRQRMLEYFTAEATDKNMWNVCKGTMTENPDGTYTVTLDRDLNYPTYIEIDGKMFYWEESVGSGAGIPYYNTAKVTEQTNDTIIFSYTYAGMADFYRTDERLVYERGGWKRDPFYQSADPEADNRELRAILKELVSNAGEIDGMFYQMSVINGEPTIKSRWADYYIIPDNLRTEPSGLNAVPQTYDEMEKLISKYFSKRAADFYLSSSNVCKAGITKDDDGTITVRPDDIHAVSNPTFVEIDGKLYRSGLEWDTHGLNLGIDCDTAEATRKSDKAIEFSYWGYDYANWYDGGDVYSERNGAIVYEDGAWKLNYFYRNGFIPEMPNEYTEQDLELQKLLGSLARGDELSALFSANSAPAAGESYKFILPGDYEPAGSYAYYVDVSDPQPQEYYKQPKSLDDLEQMLLEYFTEEKAADYMNRVCKGTMTDNGDGTYTVTLDKDVFFPVYIEIDGKMFYWTSTASGSGGLNDTAKVVEWTDDTLTYTYVGVEPGGYGIWDGTLKFERGGWKFD